MSTFISHEWKYGKTKSSIFKAIKYGYPNSGMPAFDSTFSDKEIYKLSEYMLTGINKLGKISNENKANKTNLFVTEQLSIKLDTVARGIHIPWSIAFLPNNDLLVTDRDGKLFRVLTNKTLQPIQGVPYVVSEGQGGLFDVVLHPDFANNQKLYITYSKSEDGHSNNSSTTAVMQAKLNGNVLENARDIFVAKPYSTTHHHYGGRMAFDKSGYLYFSVGERGNEKENPQTLTNDLGKIHRIKDDGSIPSDNPYINNNAARPSIYCNGNRNPQGLALNPFTGAIWENEHGPMGGDEINIIEKGKNYGWPIITYGINYNGMKISDKTAMPGMEQPVHFWVPSIATSGMAFVQSSIYKGWQGNLLSGSLKFNWLSRCTINNNQVISEESILKGIGRLRDVRMGPDGYIYVAVENPGYIFRLIPQDL
jgi:glucose/arabinose dehydrogenase